MTAPIFEDGDWRKPDRPRRTDLSEQQEAFLDWLTDPEAQLSESQASYAAKAKVSPSTLSKWKKDPIFVKAWEAKNAADNVKPERMQKLMEVLYNEGLNGGASGVKAIETYYKLNDRMTPDRIINVDERSAEGMSDDELHAELLRRADALRPGLRAVS